jgi:hypothetical protein
MTSRTVTLALWMGMGAASAQIPPSGTLSDTDGPAFRAEVARLENLLVTAPDKGSITYGLARTWASAKQWPEAIQWLQRAAGLQVGLDPTRDSVFAELRGTRQFDEILAAIRETTPPISHSEVAFQITEGDLVPESVAHDPKSGYFYFGSLRKGKVIRCSASGDCTQFAGGLDVVIGLKANGSGLWVLNNSDTGSALIHYDLPSAAIVRKYSVPGPGHSFNDLAFGPAGDVYLTDTPAGAVWHLSNGAADLTKLPERFNAANGIALSPDGRLLYVAVYPDGIKILDLRTNTAAAIAHPADLCLATIDGLYFHRMALIAIQNGFMTPRVVRLNLTHDLRAIEKFEVMERRNPLFDGVTTGVLSGRNFLYMANIQDGKKTGFTPITILKLHL